MVFSERLPFPRCPQFPARHRFRQPRWRGLQALRRCPTLPVNILPRTPRPLRPPLARSPAGTPPGGRAAPLPARAVPPAGPAAPGIAPFCQGCRLPGLRQKNPWHDPYAPSPTLHTIRTARSERKYEEAREEEPGEGERESSRFQPITVAYKKATAPWAGKG